jgi:hypothetical protein
MRFATALSLVVVSIGASLWGQTSTVELEPVPRQMPTYVQERLNTSDRIFLMSVDYQVPVRSQPSLPTASGGR